MTRLEEIVAYKKQELALVKRSKPTAHLEISLKSRPLVRDFRQAIHRPGSLSLIAEVKRASPSAGVIRRKADAIGIAQMYEKAGAQAVSVLTDAQFFQGSLADLTAVKEKVAIPVLRKDFILEEYQVLEAAAAGADAVLLIAAILDQAVLKRLLTLAQDLGLNALVEVHTERESGRVLETGAPIIGINNRDLTTFRLDLGTTERLIGTIPPDHTVVAESGLRTRQDVERMQRLGLHAVLIGEELMSSGDAEKRVRELMGRSRCG